MKIGENLKKLRKRANLTRQDAAQMLGFKKNGLTKWYNGSNFFSALLIRTPACFAHRGFLCRFR